MDLNWETFVSWAILLAFSCLDYLFFGLGFKDYYYGKKADNGYEYTNFYYVPLKPWRERKPYSFLLKATKRLITEWLVIRYPSSEDGAQYVNYRELQLLLSVRILVSIFIPICTGLAIFSPQYLEYSSLILGCVPAASYLILANPIQAHDVKRLKSYQYIVANDAEPIVAGARRKPPALWKINTLLDVFFYFGQAPIRFSETQNYLIYRLKKGKLLYVFLKDSFETMPEEILTPNEYEWRLQHYNPAMAVWVDECICVDSTDLSALSGRDINPQDMPEALLSNHS